MPLFLYRLHKDQNSYEFLGRPKPGSGSDIFILREILTDETYASILPLLGKAPIRMVDLGANLGATTIWFHRVHGVREAFCFEPDAESFRLCQFNLERNDCKCVQVFPVAVGGSSRRAILYAHTDRPSESNLYQQVEGRGNAVAQPIEVIGFSEWLDAHPGEFDLLKSDCEGAEWEILEQSPKAFARFRVVVVEVHRNGASSRGIGEFPKVLSSVGFETVRWDGHFDGIYIGKRN